MPAQDIAYVEFYTAEHRSALDYFTSSLGFTLVAESAGSAGHSVLLRQGGVRLVVTEGPSTRAFLDAHGDGIADIAFSCDNVAETRDAALAAGASLVASGTGGVAVSGFGDICHTLVAVPDAPRLPAGRDWTDLSPGADPPAERGIWIRLLDHVAVCVPAGELDSTVSFYRDVFGLAQIYDERLGRPEDAVAAYRKVLELTKMIQKEKFNMQRKLRKRK